MSPKQQLFSNSIWGSLLCLLAVLTIPMGCDSGQEEEDVQVQEMISFADEAVTILYPREIEGYFIWDAVLEEWEAQTFGRVKLVGYDRVDELLDDDSTVANPNTILFYPRDHFSEFGVRNLFQPIPEILRGPDDLDLNDLFDSLKSSMTEWNGNPAVLPIREPMMLLYYRSDLLDAAGKAPPNSWEEYLELLQSLDEWAPGLNAVEPWGPEYRSITYLTHALPYVKTRGNYSVFFDYRQGNPLVKTPGFEEGIRQSLEILPLLSPESLEMNPHDCVKEIRQGRAAIAMGSAFDSGKGLTSELDEAGEAPISVVAIPGASRVYDQGRNAWREIDGDVNRVIVTGWNGLSVGILNSGRSEDNVAAWNLLRWIMIENPSNSFIPGYQTSTRLSTSTQIWSPQFPNLNERTHVEAVTLSLRDSQVVPALMISHRDEFLNELSTMVNEAIVDKTNPPAEALKQLANQWVQLMEKYGKEKTLSSYASGLGVTIRNLESSEAR